jgi:hypothetical protein
MRAIIIDDKDSRALIQSLELASLEQDLGSSGTYDNEVWNNLPPHVRDGLIRVLHRRFHLVVWRWLQEQGCDCHRSV